MFEDKVKELEERQNRENEKIWKALDNIKSKKDEEICPNVNCKASNYVVKEKGKRKGKKGKKKEKKVKVKFAKKLAPFAVQ